MDNHNYLESWHFEACIGKALDMCQWCDVALGLNTATVVVQRDQEKTGYFHRRNKRRRLAVQYSLFLIYRMEEIIIFLNLKFEDSSLLL